MIYDACVIGAGVVGSFASFSLRKQQKNVLLLEQFPLPHTKGSSHGESRIIRCFGSNEVYSRMTRDSYYIWKEIENELGVELMVDQGILEIIHDSSTETVKENLSVLDSLDIKYDVFTSKDINRRYPLFEIPENQFGIYEHNCGIIFASKTVAGLHELFLNAGGELRAAVKVTEILPGEIVIVKTTDGEYKAKSVIIAAGRFTSEIINYLGFDLPLSVQPAYLKFFNLDKSIGLEKYTSFPSFIGPYGIYGFPLQNLKGIKLCELSRSRTHLDMRSDDSPVSRFINQYMKCVPHTQTSDEETWFTMTPDSHFILDVHPSYHNIVIGAGFSGKGFKMAPVTGKILADFAMGYHSSYDLSMFKIDRFHAK